MTPAQAHTLKHAVECWTEDRVQLIPGEDTVIAVRRTPNGAAAILYSERESAATLLRIAHSIIHQHATHHGWTLTESAILRCYGWPVPLTAEAT